MSTSASNASGDDAALLETKKLQNVRPRAGTLLSRVRAIQEAGLEVWGGMIVGFDNDSVMVRVERSAGRQRAWESVLSPTRLYRACHPTPIRGAVALAG